MQLFKDGEMHRDTALKWLTGIFVVSLGLRFWGLERFNTLVFDEVYYAVFANKYLTWTPFFDGHPPLSKYLIAMGMWVGDRLPFVPDVANNLTGSWHKTWSYRWLNALTGSLIPLVTGALVYQLTQRWRITVLAAGLLALDGLLLVESRYALNNVYLILFGLLAQVLLLYGARRGGIYVRWGAIALAGVFFGASASVKWNGLWYLLGTLGLLIVARLGTWLRSDESDDLWSKLGRLNPWGLMACLGVLPAGFYFLEWIPHLLLNHQAGIFQDFLALQSQIFTYHKGVKSGADVHPYCSSWWSWLGMLRPVAYYYRIDIDVRQMMALNAPNNPSLPGSLVYDVHAIGNPLLWWSSTIAMALALLYDAVKTVRSRLPMTRDHLVTRWINYSYLANLLPWVGVTRCIFLYHYMGSSIYGVVGLAWVCDRLMRGSGREFVQALLVVIGMAFLFWLPIYLGLPLLADHYRWRMWLSSWI